MYHIYLNWALVLQFQISLHSNIIIWIWTPFTKVFPWKLALRPFYLSHLPSIILSSFDMSQQNFAPRFLLYSSSFTSLSRSFQRSLQQQQWNSSICVFVCTAHVLYEYIKIFCFCIIRICSLLAGYSYPKRCHLFWLHAITTRRSIGKLSYVILSSPNHSLEWMHYGRPEQNFISLYPFGISL